jgi:serine/threonine-protein kinase
MELVEGEDLSQRIARGRIPIEEALSIARQIVDALESAHEQGIVHRDLKPANIKVRPDGTVKVLDFGLAKAFEPAGAASEHMSLSPTITTPAMTVAGIILGTAAYMSPEQARGKPVDKRADIWAFGAVMFEMLTAQHAFPGEDLSLTLAAVVMQEPAWAALPPATPPNVQHLLRRCLMKDPRQRIRDMGDVRLALDGANDSALAAEPQNRQRRPALAWGLAAAAAVIAIAASALAAWALFNRPTASEVRLSIPLRPGEEVTSSPAITRDGRTIAYVTQRSADDPILYLRDLNSFKVRPVEGSKDAQQPFFSPDGKWVAFFAQGHLWKAEVAGGAPIWLAEAPDSRGGTWNEDDTIIYTKSFNSGLSQVPARGGTPTSLTKPDGAAQGYAHVFPQALPGGRRVLFVIWGQDQANAVLSLDSHQWQAVLPIRTSAFGFGVFDALHGTTGRLLVTDPSAGVRAAPLDVAHPAPTSADAMVLSNVYYEVESEARPWMAVSDTRTAVYVTGNPGKTSLVWVNREEGRVESSLIKDQGIYREVSLSPDGTKAVVRHGIELWIHDLKRGTQDRLTSGTFSILPFWSVDGSKVIYGSNRAGNWDIYSQSADGSGPAEVLIERPFDQFPYAMLRDGSLLFLEIAKTGRDLWTRSPDGKTTEFLATSFSEAEGRVSPGESSGPGGGRRWIAYSSDKSGRNEIHLTSYPDKTKSVTVSSGGGTQPRWSADGKELFYVTSDALVAVTVQADGTVSASRRLFDRSPFYLPYRFQSYDATKDGRFLMIRRDEGAAPRQINVILNWTGAESPDGLR